MTSKQVGCLRRASVPMLTKLKLFQKPLDILSSGILLATDCRFMSCWRNHAQRGARRHQRSLILRLVRPTRAIDVRVCTATTILCLLVLLSVNAQEQPIRPDSREWRQMFDPPFAQPGEVPSTSSLRAALFALLRPPIARLAKRPVRFEGSLRQKGGSSLHE